jgi:radical SAM superfamily enzyme YgiQ (UPF0313 family)
LDLRAVLSAASWCKEAGLDAMAFFVIGFPGETVADMKETVDYALMLVKKYDVTPYLFTATPLPGTALEKTLLENHLLDKPLSSEALAAVTQGGLTLDGGTFSPGELIAMKGYFFRCYRWIFALKALWFCLTHPAGAVKLLRLLPNVRNKPLKQKLLTLFSTKNSCLTGKA